MNFFDEVGKMALGSRLRMLTEKITEDAANIYRLYDVALQPKWFPVFYVLSGREQKTVTAIAGEIGHSHPSVSKIIDGMSAAGIIKETKDNKDGRKNLVSLTPAGKRIVEKIQQQYKDVSSAIDEISAQATNDLWSAIGEWEFLLGQKSLLRRVEEQKKLRESDEVRIVNYSYKYQEIFKAFNEQWINRYFKMEDADHNALDDPKGYILDKGGFIMVALYKEKPAGVCALLKMNDGEYDFELAKMAVSPAYQGKNIGWLLGQAIIKKATSQGASKIYLESNTILGPAINLYHKLGFKKVAGHPTPYKRCNIQMALNL